ncbi:Glycosyltransferase AglE [uncultured archaeon]|nr:Glycosyltransferase AglE [uncultured archaeon]
MLASVIVPAYNSEKAITECIKAIRSQELSDGKIDFEIIAVDDGSTDGTAAAAEKAGAKVLRQQNAGPAKARNLGARNAKGVTLLFTDADCVPEKNWLREMLKPFADRDVVGVQGAYATRQRSLVARFVQLEIEERYERMQKHAQSLDWIGSYSAAYRAKDFFGAGGFDESFPKASGEDPELSYKLAKKGKKLVFNPSAVVYHTHPDTIWKYFRTKFYRAFYRIPLYSKHTDKIISDSYTTKSVKVQILAGYFGTAAMLMVPVLYLSGHAWVAGTVLSINTLLFIAGSATILKSAYFMSGKDLPVAAFSILMINVRTLAFMLGLPAGFIRHAKGALK